MVWRGRLSSKLALKKRNFPHYMIMDNCVTAGTTKGNFTIALWVTYVYLSCTQTVRLNYYLSMSLPQSFFGLNGEVLLFP